MLNLTVVQFMTRTPRTIDQNEALAVAHRLMREHDIRHLPVMAGGKLVGIVSQRDLHFIETLRDVDPEQVPVSEAMSTSTYTVGPRASMRKVAAEMADRKYGSVVVLDRQRVVGILTTVDALRALSALLELPLAPPR